uniref:Uncharacterized protein n=1 Tax=Macrostomum lignano TaxID=282301 RepID=A0A1I8FGP5_9PLAT
MVSAGWLGSGAARKGSAGTASQPQAQAQHQQQSADVEREFQAACSFTAAAAAASGRRCERLPLAPSDYVSPDERLRLCQEPLVPYKPLASGSQSKSPEAAAAATARDRSKISSTLKGRSSPNRPVAAAASLVSGADSADCPTGASVDSKDGEGAVEELQREPAPTGVAALQQLRRVDNSTDRWPTRRRPTAVIAVDSAAADAASVDFAKRAAAAAGVRPTSATPRPARPTLSGPRLGRRRAEHHGDCRTCQRAAVAVRFDSAAEKQLCDSMMSWGRTQPRSIWATSLWTGLSADGAPFASHSRAKAVFPRFAPPQPGSERRIPNRLELVERAARASGVTRSSIWAAPPRHLVWPGDNFDQRLVSKAGILCAFEDFYFFAWSGNFLVRKSIYCVPAAASHPSYSGFFSAQTDRQT